MIINPLIPELYVSDFRKSLYFYTEVLGFKVKYTRETPLFAFLSYKTAQIMIQEDDGKREWLSGELEYPFGRGMNLEILTTEINNLLNRLKASNYPLKKQLTTTDYKTRTEILRLKEFLVMDPDGYLLRFSQKTK